MICLAAVIITDSEMVASTFFADLLQQPPVRPLLADRVHLRIYGPHRDIQVSYHHERYQVDVTRMRAFTRMPGPPLHLDCEAYAWALRPSPIFSQSWGSPERHIRKASSSSNPKRAPFGGCMLLGSVRSIRPSDEKGWNIGQDL